MRDRSLYLTDTLLSLVPSVLHRFLRCLCCLSWLRLPPLASPSSTFDRRQKSRLGIAGASSALLSLFHRFAPRQYSSLILLSACLRLSFTSRFYDKVKVKIRKPFSGHSPVPMSYAKQNVTRHGYYVTQWHIETTLTQMGIWKVLFMQHNTHYVDFVQSQTKQSVHFRSNILWTYDQALFGRTSWHPNTVRPDTLWTYDQACYGRTSMEKLLGKHGINVHANTIL